MPQPNLNGAVLLGRGYCAEVYAWGDGRILKLFQGWVPHDQAGREYAATRAVHAAGLPAPEAYELVEVEGRCGIICERVDGVSLLGYCQARPWKLFRVIRQLAELHAQLHRVEAPSSLRSLHERLGAGIEASDSPAADKAAARARLAELPDGTSLCHGDFHPGNVLVTPRGRMVVIDWDSASRGHPLGDLACTSRLMQTASLPPWSPRYMHLILKYLRSTMHSAYLTHYLRLHPGTRREIEAWQPPLAVAARAWRVPTTPT